MKPYTLYLIMALLSFNCNGQKSDQNLADSKSSPLNQQEQPKGSWKVNKEFDENGNLIRYDSIYSWTSQSMSDDLATLDQDSLLEAYKSRFFTNFSGFEDEGFESIFSRDSLFSERFFNDDFFGTNFGKDFITIDSITQGMLARQKQFLEKYQSEFIKPERKNNSEQENRP